MRKRSAVHLYVLAVSLSAAAAVLNLTSGGGFSSVHHLAAHNLPAIFTAGAVYFVANTSLTGTALALAQGVRVLEYLGRDLLFQVSTDGMLVALAPIVVL